jgi:hypothetical protein
MAEINTAKKNLATHHLKKKKNDVKSGFLVFSETKKLKVF